MILTQICSIFCDEERESRMLLTREHGTDELSSPHIRSVVVFFLKPGMEASLKQMFTQVPNTI